jgi:hypothetical protein
MPELDQMSPEMEPTQPEMGGQVMGLEPGQTDEEGAMAKADLYKLANYSFKLFKKLEDNAQLEGWVQAKITKAADYIASVYHYLEYEMEFSEYGHKLDNSDVLSEGQKRVLKNKLMEAKAKIKELKVKQAEKAKDKVEEARMIGGGKEESCTECGGTGKRLTMGMPVPDKVEKKIEKYKRLTKATHAAHKRLDKNGDGIVSKEEEEASKGIGEEMSSTGGEITRPSKGVTRHTHNPKRFTDEPHTEPKSQAKSRSAADKAGDKASDKAAAKDSKDYEKKNPGTVTRVKDGKKVDPNAPKEKEVDEAQGGHSYGQGVYEGKGKKPDANQDNIPDYAQDGKGSKDLGKGKGGAPKKGVNPFAKKDSKVVEALKGKQKKLDTDNDNDIDAGDLANLRAKKTKKNESYVAQAVAEAKKGKKPAFLDAANNDEKDEPTKQAVADKKETVKESSELNRMRELAGRLNLNENVIVKESNEVDQLRALTKRLLG